MNTTDSQTPHGPREPQALPKQAPGAERAADPTLEMPVPTGAPEPAKRPKAMPNWAWALVVVVVAVLYYFYVARSRR